LADGLEVHAAWEVKKNSHKNQERAHSTAFFWTKIEGRGELKTSLGER